MLTEKSASWKFELETPELGNPEAVTSFHAETDTEQLDSILYDGLEFTFEGPVIVDAEARWADSDLAVSLRISAVFSAPCSRCLEPSRIEILDDFLYLYSLRKKTSAEEASAEEDFHVVPVSRWQRFFDISDHVWESIVISLPRKVLCSADCEGLCPQCGRPLRNGGCGCSPKEVDPRMEKLLGITIEETPE
ncbi:DUF177 domain-containing protein [Aminivibrio sp.]|jgi:uncharacterized protein|uniref:YceD family protein n=1 Tax=Aminivibrio sp. TaxID=1872489 RepID=UPI001A524A7D|nr:DUF177 domain-containing protein [Aminivibrio sp.]MBL3538591.1 DUF177 domain-containing protein [Aminivibrio sp.]